MKTQACFIHEQTLAGDLLDTTRIVIRRFGV